MEDSYAGPVHRIKYGSVLDYLEAKYARDVMIEDYDERERVKEKKKSWRATTARARGVVTWIDDSGLHEEVAGQVMTSSAYGMTWIVNEARKRKLEKREREKSTENGDDKREMCCSIVCITIADET